MVNRVYFCANLSQINTVHNVKTQKRQETLDVETKIDLEIVGCWMNTLSASNFKMEPKNSQYFRPIY